MTPAQVTEDQASGTNEHSVSLGQMAACVLSLLARVKPSCQPAATLQCAGGSAVRGWGGRGDTGGFHLQVS